MIESFHKIHHQWSPGHWDALVMYLKANTDMHQILHHQNTFNAIVHTYMHTASTHTILRIG